MDANEKEAVLSLVPYFSPERIVFDVGSNKGEWADILVSNCKMHLFEPNIALYYYQQIKYCHLTNVHYHNFALGAKAERREFYQYENNYNGLSSFYENPEWEDLPRQYIDVEVRKLDQWNPNIDLLKIDVEGAEYEVLQGAKKLLSKKKIKFIQFEYSEHWDVPGYTIQDVFDLIRPYGYMVYYWTGNNFEYLQPHMLGGRENYYIMDKDFTEDWNQEFIKNTQFLKGQVNFSLEIGCFEGLTTCYICDFLLTPNGRIVCIDPLEDEYLTDKVDKKAQEVNKSLQQFKGQYDRFIRNTRDKPVELKRMRSNEAFTEEFKQYKFDLIYIDGDHRKTAVYDDAVNSLSVLADGGYILFDDYHGETKRAINKFLEDYSGRVKVISKNYQMMVQNRF